VWWRLLFGYLSRACERQADLAGANLAGGPLVMAAALKSVAQLAGQPENAPSWRHYTIAERIGFLERVDAQPALAKQHQQIVQRMRNLLIALCCAITAALVAQFWLGPSTLTARDVAQTSESLARWVDGDADLGTALAAADEREDARPLTMWINRAGEFERSRLARILCVLSLGDEPTAYRQRHRLRAFLNLGTGERELDQDIENTLAYVSVACCDQPTPQDLALAQKLLPRLEERARQGGKEAHAYLDTVGCIRFAAGEFAVAAECFARAEEQTKHDTDEGAPARRELYRRRRDAARANSTIGPTGGPPLPLPREKPAIPAPAPAPKPTSNPSASP
jgi:hypothetical protein